MPFSFAKDAGKLVLRLIGDIDLEITPEIKNQLLTRLEDTRHFTIDASQVSYIDSSGISILVIAMQTCNKNNVAFSIAKASDDLMRVIELAHLDKLLPIEEKTGPAELVDVDVFSKTGQKDEEIARNLNHPDDPTIMRDIAHDIDHDIARELNSLGDSTASQESETVNKTQATENTENTTHKDSKEAREGQDSGRTADIHPDSPFKPGTF